MGNTPTTVAYGTDACAWKSTAIGQVRGWAQSKNTEGPKIEITSLDGKVVIQPFFDAEDDGEIDFVVKSTTNKERTTDHQLFRGLQNVRLATQIYPKKTCRIIQFSYDGVKPKGRYTLTYRKTNTAEHGLNEWMYIDGRSEAECDSYKGVGHKNKKLLTLTIKDIDLEQHASDAPRDAAGVARQTNNAKRPKKDEMKRIRDGWAVGSNDIEVALQVNKVLKLENPLTPEAKKTLIHYRLRIDKAIHNGKDVTQEVKDLAKHYKKNSKSESFVKDLLEKYTLSDVLTIEYKDEQWYPGMIVAMKPVFTVWYLYFSSNGNIKLGRMGHKQMSKDFWIYRPAEDRFEDIPHNGVNTSGNIDVDTSGWVNWNSRNKQGEVQHMAKTWLRFLSYCKCHKVTQGNCFDTLAVWSDFSNASRRRLKSMCNIPRLLRSTQSKQA